jgi:hypothetical protein
MRQVNADLTCPSVWSFYYAYTRALGADVIVHHGRPDTHLTRPIAPMHHYSKE